MTPRGSLETLDWALIALYFGLLLGIAWWVVKKHRDNAEDYFLAGRNLGWWLVGASIFASNIGSEHVVGLAGSGAQSGMAMAHYELHAWCLLVLAWVFVPFYARSLVFTMPEFLEKRFSAGSRYMLSIISLVAYVVTKIAVGIFAGGIVFETLLPEMQLTIGGTLIDSFWIGSILVILLTGMYTTLGGMRAVVYNDAVQAVVLIFGAVLLTFFGLRELGGWSELRHWCGSDMFNLWKPMVPEGVEATWAPVLEKTPDGSVTKMAWYFNGNFPWLGMLFCAPVVGLWYWCTDQYIVQRALGARNQQIARRGSICAAFLKMSPVFLFIIPGMICFALVQKSVTLQSESPTAVVSAELQGLADEMLTPKPGEQIGDVTQMEDGTTITPIPGSKLQASFPQMVKHLLPAGVRGIVVAGLLSALMSSLAGVFNACATLFTVDLYQKMRPKASQKELVRTGQTATVILILIALLWIPVIRGADGLYIYLQSIQGYLAPPIFVVFFLGVFFRRLNAQGCLWALITGFGLGVIRMAIDTPVTLGLTTYEEGSFLWIMNNIYFQYFSVFMTLVCAAVMVGVSLATAKPDVRQITGLTYGMTTDEQLRETRLSWNGWDVFWSVLLVGIILGIYVYFSG
ncbi:MAG: sodium:solute symporter [Planctomycetia bacterium]|nr:sodium:solute symporter [Planctomycetia bacterium]